MLVLSLEAGSQAEGLQSPSLVNLGALEVTWIVFLPWSLPLASQDWLAFLLWLSMGFGHLSP